MRSARETSISSATLDREVRRELVDGYFATAHKTAALLIGANVLLGSLFYLNSRAEWVLVWIAAAVFGPLARWALAIRYRSMPKPDPDPASWELRLLPFSAMVAAPYAVGVAYFIRDGHHMTNTMVTLWYVMLITVTVPSAFQMPRSVLLFCGLVGAALSLRLAWAADAAYRVAAIGVGIYTFALLVYARESYRSRRQTLLQFAISRHLAESVEQQAKLARTASEEKSRFIAAASHDLRQPVHALALLGRGLQDSLAGTEHAADVTRMVRAVSELTESLNDMLDLSRIEAGTMTLQNERVELAGLFASLSHRYIAQANERELKLRFAHGGRAVWGDRQALMRVLGNLIENGLKYCEAGGVLVVARRRAWGAQFDTVIEVRDSGLGIDRSQHDLIFDEFFQIAQDGVVRGDGLGLGLSIVRRLVSLMDMQVTVRSALGCGTRFELHCRQAASGAGGDASRAIAAATPGAARLAGRTVLVVDNDRTILAAVSKLLKGYGVNVHSCESAEAAMAWARGQLGVDAALLDFRLGTGRTGIELAADLRAMEGLSDLPIVLVTGDTHSPDIRGMLQAGETVLFKPVEAPQLLSALATTMLRGAR